MQLKIGVKKLLQNDVNKEKKQYFSTTTKANSSGPLTHTRTHLQPQSSQPNNKNHHGYSHAHSQTVRTQLPPSRTAAPTTRTSRFATRRDASRQKENRPTAEQIHQSCPPPDYCITQQAHFFFFFSSMTTWVADWGPAITWLLTGVVVDVVWDGTAVA